VKKIKKMNRNIREIRRYKNSAKIFGVCSGIAIWADLDVAKFQLIIFLVVLFTGFFPGAIIYLILALIIPPYKDTDSFYNSSYRSSSPFDDESDESNEELKKKYEDLKHKVEDMESSMFDKERDWDKRFHEK